MLGVLSAGSVELAFLSTVLEPGSRARKTADTTVLALTAKPHVSVGETALRRRVSIMYLADGFWTRCEDTYSAVTASTLRTSLRCVKRPSIGWLVRTLDIQTGATVTLP